MGEKLGWNENFFIDQADKTPHEFILSVTNGGEPIPANAIRKLFEPFARGQSSNSNQGLGLGLFIIDKIAKAHGGRMTVTSKNAETKFAFGMPLKKTSDARTG